MKNFEPLINKLSDNAELGFAAINRMQELLTKELAHKNLPPHLTTMIKEDLIRLRHLELSLKSLELLEGRHIRKGVATHE
jgi:hypothetical protein